MSTIVTEQEVRTTCPYCGVGCGVIAKTQAQEDIQGRKIVRLVEVRGDTEHPANLGRLCSKGSQLMQTADPAVYSQVRAEQPEIRTHRNSQRLPSDWATASDYVAEKFAQTIADHGPDSVAFYISGQLLTEDYYVFNKLAKGLIGTNNIDTNSRLCMSSAVTGYKRSLGADAPPCSYEDIELADCVFIAGSNMAFAHPVLFRRLEAVRQANPNHKLIVVDPRRTDTAEMADLHLQIQPGTDVMLFNAMMHVLLREGLLDGAYISGYTEGFESVSEALDDYSPALAAQICGVPEADIIKAARWFGSSEKSLSLYCQGLNQATTGTDKNTSLIALHLATGKIGKPGCGPFSLTGQPNAMGGREVGGMATLLPAHREMSNPDHVREVADLWNVRSVCSQPGADAVELFRRLETGQIKAVWVACTNPVNSLPNSAKVRRALENAEFVVVQDAYLSPATVEYADVLLPATTWGEKEGTVTNSERRITRLMPVLPPYAQSRHDWDIALEIGRKLEIKLQEKGFVARTLDGSSLFNWAGLSDIFDEHARTTCGRDLDISGLNYSILEEQGPQQWPFPTGATQGKNRLYEDGVFPTPNGKARFVFARYEPVAEDADARFPWRLNTGRLRDQWHGGGRTGTLASFFSHEPEPAVSMNPSDCKRLMLAENDWVTIKTRRGAQTLRVKPDTQVQSNQAYVPMHWGPEYLGGLRGAGGVNALTLDAVDPLSKQPELKHASANIIPASPVWECVAFMENESWLGAWLKARQLFQQFDAAYCVPIGREKPGLLFRASHSAKPDPQTLAALEALFGLNNSEVLSYIDPVSGSKRVIKTAAGHEQGQVVLQAVLLAGDCRSEAWLRQFLDAQTDVTPVRRYLLAPFAEPPGVQVNTDKVICNCTGVTLSQIRKGIVASANNCTGELDILQNLKGGLGCGGQCGSCVPELKKIIATELSVLSSPKDDEQAVDTMEADSPAAI